MFECPRCHTAYDDPPAFCGACGTKIPGVDPLAPPEADPLIGMIVDARYRIVDAIGRGGMGAVYRVEHVKMGKIMAMKILHGELSQNSDLALRFRREAETVSRLTHLNTVSVFDFGSHQGMMYLVMEYIDGQDLAHLLRAAGPVPFSRAAKILIQVCSALGEAHGKGIVHRDLKPENVLITVQDEHEDFVKVLDFGLAKLRDVQERTKITAKGSLVGTPYYMAPEHIRGEGVDQRTDIYALGAVTYKLLTGETPFTADTPMGIITKHLTEQPEPPSERHPRLDIPAAADEIVLRAMSKQAADRYATAEEMRRALADALEGIAPGSSFRRFSSHGDPSWHLGEQMVGEKSDWNVSRSEDEPARESDADPRATRPSARPSKSVIIDSREIQISTKSDFIQFEHGLRARRAVKVVVGATIALAVVAAALALLFFVGRDDSDPTRETEPNDDSSRADTMAPGTTLAGVIAGEGSAADVDWYRLPGPQVTPWAVQVEVSGVPGLDLAVQLVDPASPTPLAIANVAGQGGGETIHPRVVSQKDLFLIVQEVRVPGVPPGSFAGQSYQVTYRMYDATYFEREPNDDVARATPIRLGATMSGAMGGGDKADWYCLPAGQRLGTVQVTGVAGIDIGLILRLGPGGTIYRIDNAGVGQGEGATLPEGPGPSCVAVGEHEIEGREASGNTGPYQILFR